MTQFVLPSNSVYRFAVSGREYYHGDGGLVADVRAVSGDVYRFVVECPYGSMRVETDGAELQDLEVDGIRYRPTERTCEWRATCGVDVGTLIARRYESAQGDVLWVATAYAREMIRDVNETVFEIWVGVDDGNGVPRMEAERVLGIIF